MDFWHIDFASEGRLPLLQTEQVRRAAARTLWRVVGGIMLLFGSADEHLHQLLFGERARVGRLTQASSVAIGRLTGRKMKPAYIGRVESRAHLEHLLPYLLGQRARHGLPDHPALWSASAFPDLVGALAIEGAAPDLRLALPRHQEADIFQAVGLPWPLRDLPSDDEIRSWGARRIADAAGAALAVCPGLQGKHPDVAMARRAAAQLAQRVGLRVTEVAETLRVSQRAIRAEHQQHVPPDTARALFRRLALERLVDQVTGRGTAGQPELADTGLARRSGRPRDFSFGDAA